MESEIKENKNEALAYLKTLPRYNNSSIKSAYWRLKFFINIIGCRLLKKNKPLFMVLVTNNGCNLDCTYCYGCYGTRKVRDYSTQKLIDIINELKKLGTINLTVHGGEALLRKDIGEILNYAKLKGFYITLNTNGYYVPDKIEEIKCVDNISLSLDGKKENNDLHRGEGTFDKVMRAVDVIKGKKIPCVISATVTKQTLNDIEYLAELAKNKKLRLQYSLLYNMGELKDKEISSLLISDKEARGAAQTMLELKQKGFPIYYSDNVLKAAIDWPAKYHERQFFTKDEEKIARGYNLIKCYHGKLKYQLDADGRVVTCWGHNKPDAPNIENLGVRGAIEQCAREDNCSYCIFLANNEHNALLGLSGKNIWNTVKIQASDVVKNFGHPANKQC